MRRYLSRAAAALAVATAASFPLNSNAAQSPGAHVEFDVSLPLRNVAELDRLIALQGDETSPLYHRFLTPAQFAARYGPAAATVDAAIAALRARGFGVGRVGAQSLHVRGNLAQVESAFAIRVDAMRSASLRPVVRGALRLPSELQAAGATIVGLDAVPDPLPASRAVPLSANGAYGFYWFTDLKQAYQSPSYVVDRGSGVTVATVNESDFRDSDAALYFRTQAGYAGDGSSAPNPEIRHLYLSGAAGFNPKSMASFEADLDVQQVAGGAPGATVINIDTGDFFDTYSYIVSKNDVDIVSTSYVGCELSVTPAYTGGYDDSGELRSYNALFKQGNAQGITFVFSSGDWGGRMCPEPGYFGKGTGKIYKDVPSVGFWADDPNVTAVGGTVLETTPGWGVRAASYVGESEYASWIGKDDMFGTGNYVDNEIWGSGGGVSVVWPRPPYQAGFTKAPGRSVPDVAMDMSGCILSSAPACLDPKAPSGGWRFIGWNGKIWGAGGTSASAPEFAAQLALDVAARKSRLGNVNAALYKLAASNATGHYFHQGIPGWNGVVSVAKGQRGYNAITGLGSPIGTNFMRIPATMAAGDPGTPSNP